MNNMMFQDIRHLILIGTMFLGFLSGLMSVLLVLRSQSLMGDVLAHSTYPGVVLAFIMTRDASFLTLIIGALVANALALALIHALKSTSSLKMDAILALTLSSFFGVGRFLVSFFSRQPGFGQITRLDDFIFGSVATMIERDVQLIVIISLIIILVLLAAYRPIKMTLFDSMYSSTIMNKSWIIEFIISVMMSLIIVIGSRLVGAILMIALLVMPAIIARQWSSKFVNNLIIASVIGALSSLIGVYISFSLSRVPTGPLIVIVGFILMSLSLLMSNFTMWVHRQIVNKKQTHVVIKERNHE